MELSVAVMRKRRRKLTEKQTRSREAEQKVKEDKRQR